jgi:hypothetical protein
VSEDASGYDSISAAARLARSSRVRTLLTALAAVAVPALTAAAGWAAKSIETQPGIAANAVQLAELTRQVAGLRTDIAAISATQRNVVSIGRQAAYATAGFESYETPKVLAQKKAWAERYAASYERLVVQGGQPAAVAYTALFEQVAVP